MQAKQTIKSLNLLKELQLTIQPSMSLHQTLSQLYLPYDEPQRKEILELLQYWHNSDLQELIIEQFTGQKQIQWYKKYQVLAAVVFAKIQSFVQDVKCKKISNQKFEGAQKLGEYLRENQLQLSLDKHFWQKRKIKSYSGYHAANSQLKHQQPPNNQAQKISQLIKNSQSNQLNDLDKFLRQIGFVCYGNIDNLNPFLVKLDRLSRNDQKTMYINDLTSPCLFQILKLPNYNSRNYDEQISKGIQYILQNYLFYKNQLKQNKQRYSSISFLHQKYQHYDFLQQRHDYVQWMFPNHYGSAFNSQSWPLNYIEAKLFLLDKSIGLHMLKSIFIFMDFMGIYLDLATLELILINEYRFKQVILVNYHNHLRIMRILACLSVTGFRKIALNLIQFLDLHSQKGGIIEQQRHEFQKSWLIYDDSMIEKAKQMCFIKQSDFPQQHSILQIVNKKAELYQLLKQTKPVMQVQDFDDYKKEESVDSEQQVKYIANKPSKPLSKKPQKQKPNK